MTTLPDEIGELNGAKMAERENGETTLPDEIGELKELENASCGWKSCNVGRNEKSCENTEDFKPCPQNRVLRNTCVFF